MHTARIVVATDFGDIAARALEQAVAVATSLERSITLLHITTSDKVAEAQQKAAALCTEVRKAHHLDIDYAVEVGELEEDLGHWVERLNAKFVVLGSYGIRGLSQHLFGARILRVLRRMHVPAVVVQGQSPVLSRFRKILVPIDDIEPFDQKVQSVIAFAKWHGSEVMLYALRHPMTDEDKVKAHATMARKLLAKAGIAFGETEESPKVFSSGMAKQTLLFAKSWGADLIAISMAEPPTNAKLNQAECEQVLNNENHVAVLCTPERLDSDRIFA